MKNFLIFSCLNRVDFFILLSSIPGSANRFLVHPARGGSSGPIRVSRPHVAMLKARHESACARGDTGAGIQLPGDATSLGIPEASNRSTPKVPKNKTFTRSCFWGDIYRTEKISPKKNISAKQNLSAM
jgi:hypothetical protein